MSQSRYVLDACALLSLLQDEEGAEKVSDLFNAALVGEAFIAMHKLNLLEVYYDVYRSAGKVMADNIIMELKSKPILIISEISDAIFAEAGRIKASYKKVSFADAFALAVALVSGSMLVTSDHHEMDAIEQSEKNIGFYWIR